MRQIVLVIAFLIIIFSILYIPKSQEQEKTEEFKVENPYTYNNPELTIETTQYVSENGNVSNVKTAKCQGCHWKCCE
jgi:hypothetical protein